MARSPCLRSNQMWTPDPAKIITAAAKAEAKAAEEKAAAKATVKAAIDTAAASILDAYPLAERMGWDAKAAEASAVLSAGESATLDMAPLLVAECAAEMGVALDEDRLVQLIAKASAVAAKATAWGELMATLSGIRGKAYAAIDAAEDGTATQAAVTAAIAEIAAAAS